MLHALYAQRFLSPKTLHVCYFPTIYYIVLDCFPEQQKAEADWKLRIIIKF